MPLDPSASGGTTVRQRNEARHRRARGRLLGKSAITKKPEPPCGRVLLCVSGLWRKSCNKRKLVTQLRIEQEGSFTAHVRLYVRLSCILSFSEHSPSSRIIHGASFQRAIVASLGTSLGRSRFQSTKGSAEQRLGSTCFAP